MCSSSYNRTSLAEEQRAKMERNELARLSVMNSIIERGLRNVGASESQVEMQQEQSRKVCTSTPERWLV